MDKPARLLTQAEALVILKADVPGLKVGDNGRVTLPAVLEGVAFTYVDGKLKDSNNIDPRFGVFLLRFARFLRSHYNIIKIQHMGMWPAAYGQPSHDNGIAIDFSGADSDDGVTYRVLRDWGSKPKTPGRYRLNPPDHGYQFFKDVYTFTGIEGDDRWDGTQTVIGQEDSFISHADLHDSTRAAKHANHMHLQAGQTPISKGGSVPKQTEPKKPPTVATAGVSGRDNSGTLLAVGAAALIGLALLAKK